MTQLACFTSFQPKPVTIESLCESTEKKLVVEGLSDGSIQFRDFDTLVHIGAIPGNQLRSVRRIIFFGDSIITSGVHGAVSMWCLKTFSELCSVESSQGAIWDMALGGSKLYLATETGAVVVVDLSSSSMSIASIWRTSGKKGSQVRSLSVCLQKDHLFVGDASGSISRWNLSSGLCDNTFSIPAKNNKAVLVWTMCAIGEGRIVTGDSCGALSVWDSISCTLVQTRQDHQADILVFHTDNDYLYSSGVDARIVKYLWTDSLTHHTTVTVVPRDVSAITGTTTRLLVGGAEGRLGVVAKASTYKLDRFTHLQTIVANQFVLSQAAPDSLQLFRVSDQLKGQNEFLAELVEKESIASFALSTLPSVAITTASGKCAILGGFGQGTLSEKKLSVGKITASAVSEKFFVGVSTIGEVVWVDLQSMKESRFVMDLGSCPKSVLLCDEKNAIVVCGEKIVKISQKKILKSLNFNSLITAVSANGLYVATADRQIHHQVDCELVWSKKIPKTCKLGPYQYVSQILPSSEELILVGEAFAIVVSDLAGRTGLFRAHSSYPMGGLIVGAGKNKEEPIVVLAELKKIQAQLVRPFDRKCFQ